MTAGSERLRGETLIIEPTRTERALGRRMAETRATVPDLEFGAEADADAALQVAREHGCSLTVVLVRACALALRQNPRANAAYREGRFELYSRVNIAVAVQADDGIVAPTLVDADSKPLPQLHAELETAIARARSGQLTPPELSGATFTLTDYGSYGVTRATPVIVAPQAAALAAGAPQRSTIALTLASDGRILYGAHAAAFLRGIVDELAQ